MTTKEQELKALDQIKKIVESLGENSYIGTAFEGCFDIAEENIRNDFGCSMKQRAESAEAKVESLSITLRDCKAEIERMTEARKNESSRSADVISFLKEKNNNLKKKICDAEHYKEIWNLCYDNIESNKAWMDTHADTMADFSETPTDIAFINAAKNYKKCRAAYEAQKKLLEYLDTIAPENI